MRTMSSFDPASNKARELLSYFGRNTAIRVDHKYGSKLMSVMNARTGNLIAMVNIDEDLQAAALEIKGMKKFPRVRNMKRAWSPIVLTPQALKEQDIRRATILNYGY